MRPLSNIIKNILNDLKNIIFYKKKQFIILISYILILIYIYIFNYELISNYILGINKKLKIIDLFSYPSGYSDSTQIIKSLFTNPIQLFTLIFAILLQFFVNIQQNNIKQYIYSVVLSFILTTILLVLHSTIFKIYINSDEIEISDEFNVNNSYKSYKSLYGGQWMLLYAIAPIYSFIIFYMHNKLFSK